MALRVIDQWEKEFPAVYAHLQELLPMPINEFEKKLNDFDADAYAIFEVLYPRLTAGNKFNPFTGYDVVELYDAVCKKLPEKKYSGLFVVYDEFSKYLESSIEKASINDVKLLQDFAEKCCRSGASQLRRHSNGHC